MLRDPAAIRSASQPYALKVPDGSQRDPNELQALLKLPAGYRGEVFCPRVLRAVKLRLGVGTCARRFGWEVGLGGTIGLGLS